MQEFVLPVDSVDDIVDTVAGCVGDESVANHLRSVAGRREGEHQDWWQFLVTEGLQSSSEDGGPLTPEPPQFTSVKNLPNRFNKHTSRDEALLDAIEQYGYQHAVQARKLTVARSALRSVEDQLSQVTSNSEVSERSVDDFSRRLKSLEASMKAVRKDVERVRHNTSAIGFATRKLKAVRARLKRKR
jgi:colanic acid/amylovoran biosynthesis protein